MLQCRFCAEAKSPDEMVDLSSSPIQLEETMSHLIALRLETLVDMTLCDNMTKLACLKCLALLGQSSRFVKAVEKAQEVLRDSVNDVKTEKYDGEIFDYLEETDSVLQEIDEKKPDLPEVKSEEDTEQSGEYDRPETARKKRPSQSKRKVNQTEPQQVAFDSKATWENVAVRCRRCSLVFPNFYQLKTHAKSAHEMCSMFRCIYCDKKRFGTFSSFLIHMRKHEVHLKCCCHVCCEKFDSTSSLTKHVGRHALEYVCEFCGDNFNSEDELKLHRSTYKKFKNRNKQPPKIEDVTCNECGKVFKTKVILQVHMQLHMGRTRNHTCEVCGETFYNKGTLKCHQLRHADHRPHKCLICGMAFKRTNQLQKHVHLHTGIKPHSCEQCGKSFRLRYQLTSHMIVHTDLMPHTCEYCGKSFKFKTLLNRHVLQHTGAKPYRCAQCQREFSNWGNYNKHMKGRHNLDMSKRKRTPDGLYPIDPVTGEVQCITKDVEEWKNNLFKKKPRSSKRSQQNNYVESVADVKEEGLKVDAIGQSQKDEGKE